MWVCWWDLVVRTERVSITLTLIQIRFRHGANMPDLVASAGLVSINLFVTLNFLGTLFWHCGWMVHTYSNTQASVKTWPDPGNNHLTEHWSNDADFELTALISYWRPYNIFLSVHNFCCRCHQLSSAVSLSRCSIYDLDDAFVHSEIVHRNVAKPSSVLCFNECQNTHSMAVTSVV